MLTVAAGTPFDLELGSGPSAGYVWEPESLPEGIVLLGSDYRETTPGQIGGGGSQVFHLKPLGPGRYALRFVRKRRWETQPIETRDFEIEAR